MEIREYSEYREDEILSLYDSVGWAAYTENPDILREGFHSSLCVLAAYEGNTLAGLVRVVGDGQTVVLVQDLLVSPAFQRRGIGSTLLSAMLKRYQSVRQFQLLTDDASEILAFYRSAGLRLVSEIGCVAMIR